MMRQLISVVMMLVAGGAAMAQGPARDYPFRPVPFTAVKTSDVFWAPRIEANRTATIPTAFRQCEATGRLENFRIAGGLSKATHRGEFGFDDSDVYKVIEGASYSLMAKPDAALAANMDQLISWIAAAQEDDGYLYTAMTNKALGIVKNCKPIKERWDNLVQSHEHYNAGHLFEAAVAHYQATGKRALLDVAIKFADLLCREFGPGKRQDPPGHQEIEIGLVRLYRATGEARYLDLAKFFLDVRGKPNNGRKLYGEYAQDHKPVVEQKEAIGHAVRANYMYAAMTDVAALTGDASYREAAEALWKDIVRSKYYVTGGVGARRSGEAYGAAFELPNADAYCETCAAIAFVNWCHRLFLLEGEGKYIDTLERTLYNAVLAGVALDGKTFFYPNPLESDGVKPFNQGKPNRQPWFGCACCPSNIARFMASVPGLAYASKGDAVYVNLYLAGQASIRTDRGVVKLDVDTRYPWDGRVLITVHPEKPGRFPLLLRLPGWARNEAMPADLYRFTESSTAVTRLVVGRAEPVDARADARGYCVVESDWQDGSTVELTLAMPVRKLVSSPQVQANVGRVALQRGPLVYCIEGADVGGDKEKDKVFKVRLPENAHPEPEWRADLLGGAMVLKSKAALEDGSPTQIVAVPYALWCNRGPNPMLVWIPAH